MTFNMNRAVVAAPETQNSKLKTQHSSIDSLFLPLALSAFFFLLYALTATSFHTFDGIAYIRDMGKPLAAMVLPHHLIYEPVVLGAYRLWQALGWSGHADLPAQVLSSLAGAAGLAVFYKLAWELSGWRPVSLLAALVLALSYGYWFYSVEVEIYVPPLLFLLVAAWLLFRALRGGPVFLYWLVGLSQAVAALIHQASLFLVPAFGLGILLTSGSLRVRVGRAARYGLALVGVVIPAYLFAGVVIAGQNTPETFMRWANNYGHLGTWGVWRTDSLDATVSGLSAAVSAEFWSGRLLAACLLVVLVRAVPITRRGGAFAWTLWLWFAIYGLFFAWWQPENLKFWVLMLPSPLLLLMLAFEWSALPASGRNLAIGLGTASVLALALVNAPTVWAKRDPMSDPARQVSAALGRLSGREDLIVLQAGSAEHFLPFYYDRSNIMSTRELWYLYGGAAGHAAAASAVRSRIWHALAKGSSVWLEDRAVQPGRQISDHYVFNQQEAAMLLQPYGDAIQPEQVPAGPQVFYRLSPDNAYAAQSEWHFLEDQGGWSGVNISGEQVGKDGWCFSAGEDPNLYGPPLKLPAEFDRVEIVMQSRLPGKAQLFYRTNPANPYREERSLSFDVLPGEHLYGLDTGGAPGWAGKLGGLRLDPVEGGSVTGDVGNDICIRSIRLLKPDA